jgi:hypothetical protein
MTHYPRLQHTHANARRTREFSLAARWLAVLVFIDLLFMPRLLFAFGIPMSLLIVIVSLIRERFKWRGVICIFALCASMFTSVTYGTASGINAVPIESLKRVFQLVTILLYALYRLDLPLIGPALVKVLRAFYIWVFCAMLLFFFDPVFYAKLATYIYPETLDQLENTIFVFRFAYFFSDPNSAGYFICLTLVAYLSMERQRSWTFLCATLATITVMATQSRGAYIALLLIFFYFMYGSDAPLGMKLRVIVFIALLMGALATFYNDDITQAYAVFEGRFDQEDDIGGGRADKYAYFLQKLNLLPFGPGYHLQRDGSEFRPHSDLIRLNLAYGILAIPLMLYFVIPRRRPQVLLFAVFLVPFLINTVIDDYRLFPMYLLCFALLGQLDTSRAAKPAIKSPCTLAKCLKS